MTDMKDEIKNPRVHLADLQRVAVRDYSYIWI